MFNNENEPGEPVIWGVQEPFLIGLCPKFEKKSSQEFFLQISYLQAS
jgi:hypothetical protein